MEPFTVPPGMEERLARAIKGGKRNGVVGRNGIHGEMMQKNAELCAELLRAWWETVGRTSQFPET